MIKSRYSDLELYNLWISGTHIDELCEMAGIEDRKTLYKRFDRLRYRQQNSTKSTEIVENDDNSGTTYLVEVDNKPVDNVEDTNPATDTIETEKANPVGLLIVGIILLLIWVGKCVYDWYKRWQSQRSSNSNGG